MSIGTLLISKKFQSFCCRALTTSISAFQRVKRFWSRWHNLPINYFKISTAECFCSNVTPTVTLSTTKNGTSDKAPAEQLELPENLSVLIVDDDMVLRNLLSRSIKRIAPAWSVQEAANGGTALSTCDDSKFDLIFLDQYMASIEKQLLGTETAYALRAKGVTSIELTANNLEDSFVESGADEFLLKMLRVLQKKSAGGTH